MKPKLRLTSPEGDSRLTLAARTLHALPREGAVVGVSLRVERDRTTSLVLHLESGEDVSVPRRGGEAWAEAIVRFNAEVPA